MNLCISGNGKFEYNKADGKLTCDTPFEFKKDGNTYIVKGKGSGGVTIASGGGSFFGNIFASSVSTDGDLTIVNGKIVDVGSNEITINGRRFVADDEAAAAPPPPKEQVLEGDIACVDLSGNVSLTGGSFFHLETADVSGNAAFINRQPSYDSAIDLCASGNSSIQMNGCKIKGKITARASGNASIAGFTAEKSNGKVSASGNASLNYHGAKQDRETATLASTAEGGGDGSHRKTVSTRSTSMSLSYLPLSGHSLSSSLSSASYRSMPRASSTSFVSM